MQSSQENSAVAGGLGSENMRKTKVTLRRQQTTSPPLDQQLQQLGPSSRPKRGISTSPENPTYNQSASSKQQRTGLQSNSNGDDPAPSRSTKKRRGETTTSASNEDEGGNQNGLEEVDFESDVAELPLNGSGNKRTSALSQDEDAFEDELQPRPSAKRTRLAKDASGSSPKPGRSHKNEPKAESSEDDDLLDLNNWEAEFGGNSTNAKIPSSRNGSKSPQRIIEPSSKASANRYAQQLPPKNKLLDELNDDDEIPSQSDNNVSNNELLADEVMSESVENTAIVKEGEDSEQGAALNMDDSQIDQDEDALTPSIANNDDDNDLNESFPEITADDPETKQALATVRDGKTEAKKARDYVEGSYDKLYELKFEELSIEESLIRNGTHPDYVQALADIESAKDEKLRESADRRRCTIQNCDFVFDCEVKLVFDTFLDAQRDLRLKLMHKVTSNRFNLENEFEMSQMRSPKVPSFSMSPVVLSKRKRNMMDDYAGGNLRNDLEKGIPEWVELLVHKRNKAGYNRMYIPSSCVGLDDNEMDEDINFLRLLNKKTE